MPMTAINPATGETIKEYVEMTAEEASKAIAEASGAFSSWRRVCFVERSALMTAAAGLLRERIDEYAGCSVVAEHLIRPAARDVEVAVGAKG